LKTILVVEDEADILMGIKEFLQDEGFKVLTAQNGMEAMKKLKNNEMPNLILLDMKMPVMDGWKFAEEFHKIFDNLSPILVVTAAADAKQRALDIGASGWIEKPFQLDELLKKINHELGPTDPILDSFS
jgi:DNA-binding response OmpR family regulator